MKKRKIYLICFIVEAILLTFLINPLIGFLLMFKQIKSIPSRIYEMDNRIVMYGILVIILMIFAATLVIINIINYVKGSTIKNKKKYIIISSIWLSILLLVTIIFSTLAISAFVQKHAIIEYSTPIQYCFMTTILSGVTIAVLEFIKSIKTDVCEYVDITLNEKEIIVIKSLLIQKIDYLETEIKNHIDEDKKSNLEEKDICINLLNRINR